MRTLHIEHPRERRSLWLRWALTILISVDFAGFVLAAKSLHPSYERETASAVTLSPVAVPVPTPPTAAQWLYASATPAAPTWTATKAQPEWEAVPMPPISETPGVALQAERLSRESSSRVEGILLLPVVLAGLVALTIIGLLAWVWLRRETKPAFKQRVIHKGNLCITYSRKSGSQRPYRIGPGVSQNN
jgi:hypothetical protein